MSTLAIAFIVYSALIIGIGLAAGRRENRTDSDYYLGGRSLGPWVAAFSASASSSSGWTTMGLVGMAFAGGAMAYWIIPGVLLGFMFNWIVIAPRLRDRAAELDALTLPDLFAFHFQERVPLLRSMSVGVVLVAMFLYTAAQFAAAGKAFEVTFVSVDYKVGVMIGAAYVLAYTVFGGFRASCWTDFAQFIVMLVTLVGVPLYLVVFLIGAPEVRQVLGGYEGADLLRILPTSSGLALIGFLLGSRALGINLGYPGQPHVLVRFMAMRDRRNARIGLIVSIVWGVLTVGGAVSVGLIVRALVLSGQGLGPEQAAQISADSEIALVAAARDLMPGVLAGVVLAGILSAICSTVDSQLIVAASSVTSDVYARLVPGKPNADHLWLNRTVVLALGLGAAAMVMFDQTITVYTYVLTYGWAVLGAAFGPQLILLLTWRRASYAGCVAGMGTGFVVAIGWHELYPKVQARVEWLADVSAYNLTVAFFAALGVNMVVSLMTPGGGAGAETPARGGAS
jgi:sodium/proline symporter